MQFRLVLILTATAMLAALFPAPARADAASDFHRNQAFQRINTDNYLNEVPELDADHPSRPMADVFSLSPLNGQLILHTNLPTTTPMGQPRKLKIDSADSWSIVNIADGATGSGPVIPTTFTLNQTRFDPQHTDVLNVQQMKGTYLSINKQSQSATGRDITQLQMQFSNPAQNNPGVCQLVIMRQVTGRPGPAQSWESANLSTFMREHPVEADRYIRPLFHQLGQDSALSPDPMLTFEVFSDQWTPDAATSAKITSLIANLAGGDFHTRSHAEHDLAALGKDAAVVMMHLDRSKLNAEQNARIDKVLAPYLPVSAKDAAPLRTDPTFLLDCLYSNDPVVRKIALTQLESVAKLKLNFDPNADNATRNAAIPAILDTLRKNHVLPNN